MEKKEKKNNKESKKTVMKKKIVNQWREKLNKYRKKNKKEIL